MGMFRSVTLSKELVQLGAQDLPPDFAATIHNVKSVDELTPEQYRRYEIWMCCNQIDVWKKEKCPYYRVYPGVLESIMKLDLDKLIGLDRTPFPFGIHTLEIEIPEEYWHDAGGFSALLIADLGRAYAVTIQGSDLGIHSTYIDFDYLKETLPETSEITQTFVKIILGVLAIGENPDIVKPVVLRADEQKYQLTGDEKYIDKARRRGVIGFNIGEDIPTKARLKQMVQENEIALSQGRKAPHIRSACLALVHTGKGRSLPKIVKRKGCYVNKELLIKTPQGFYIE